MEGQPFQIKQVKFISPVTWGLFVGSYLKRHPKWPLGMRFKPAVNVLSIMYYIVYQTGTYVRWLIVVRGWP